MRKPQGGFTLVEMMMVVAIIGVLTTLAIVHIKGRPRPIDSASRFSGVVAEASRAAVQGGPVRGDVALAEGSKRRTRITAQVVGPQVVFHIEKLVEGSSATPTWEYLGGMITPKQVTANMSAAGSVDWPSFSVSCFPDGTCSAVDVYFSQLDAGFADRYARVTVLPLGTAAYVKASWN